MTKHTKLRIKVVNSIYQLYPSSFIYCPVDMVRKGIPDILWLHDGTLIAIEIKIYPDRLDAIQRQNLMDIKRAGGISILIEEKNNKILMSML